MNVAVVGHAIVSADGMIADAAHRMPARLRIDADWQRFQRALDQSTLVVLGRTGHLAHPNPGRRRLVVTSRVPALARDPADANATFWNPAGLDFEAMLARLEISAGTIAVTGGQSVFDLFVPVFTQFDLAEVADVTIPDGVSCFSSGPPAAVLASAGMGASERLPLAEGVTLTLWRR